MKNLSRQEQSAWQRLSAAWDRGDHACRLELARRYTRSYPENMAGWLALADVLSGFARYEEARSALRRAQSLAADDELVHVWVQLGHLHQRKGNHKRAELWYRRAVDAEPTTSRLVFLGGLLARCGRAAEAKRCLRRAIRLASEPPDEAYFNLGLILRAEGRYQNAMACFDRALELDPAYRAADEARRDCRQAIAVRSGK